jgi:CubicO group peptidase (beta-lactamase class C family)
MDLSAEVADWPGSNVAVAVLGPSGVLDRFETTPARAFPWASVTKIVTALTVLDACADGTLALDDPVAADDAVPTGDRWHTGVTVAHLLAHAAGLPFDRGAPVAPPGLRRTYSNFGYELLGGLVARAAGGPFRDEIAGRVLQPLSMSATTVDGSPASSGIGPLDDLLALAAELLEPTVLAPGIVAQASKVAFPGLSGILPGFGRQPANDWGLGCEIRDSKSPHWTSAENSPATFGHFGQSGSFLWVDPVARLACAGLSDRPFGPWAAAAWPRLSTAVLQEYAR